VQNITRAMAASLIITMMSLNNFGYAQPKTSLKGTWSGQATNHSLTVVVLSDDGLTIQWVDTEIVGGKEMPMAPLTLAGHLGADGYPEFSSSVSGNKFARWRLCQEGIALCFALVGKNEKTVEDVVLYRQ
jgi:hypothetical protein